MSMAFEVSHEDVATVCRAHGITQHDQIERCFDLVTQKFDERVTRAALWGNDLDKQTQYALAEIERILLEQGHLRGGKRFEN